MWLFTTKGFFSIVANAEKPGHVLIRARAKADIANLYRTYRWRFKMTRPKADDHRDYRWRISMRRIDAAKIAEKEVRAILYYNFKDAVHGCKDQENKSRAYIEVWSAMRAVQRGEDPKPE